MIALLLAFQATAAEAPPAAIPDIHFNLAKLRPSDDANEIVVRGRRIDERLPQLPDLHEDVLPKAQTGLLGGTAAFVTEAKALPGGVTSNRIMLNWKVKF